MSRKTVVMREKAGQLRRKRGQDAHTGLLIPHFVVKGRGIRCGWRKDDNGNITRFPPIKTNEVCSRPMGTAKQDKLLKVMK